MANTQAYNGFQSWFGGSGGASTWAQSVRRIASGNATAIYSGDPVMPVVGTATGYITQASPGSTVIDGIFVGCKYLSTSQKRTVWSPYWPGSDATGDIEAYIIDDPNAQFIVQTSTSAFQVTGSLTTFTSSPVGQYAQFSIGSGNTSNGQSGAYLSSLNTTVTFPFIVRDMYVGPSNGGDPTALYCKVIVGFNNEWLRTNGAGPTGIS
jgi:hypothetical protein